MYTLEFNKAKRGGAAKAEGMTFPISNEELSKTLRFHDKDNKIAMIKYVQELYTIRLAGREYTPALKSTKEAVEGWLAWGEQTIDCQVLIRRGKKYLVFSGSVPDQVNLPLERAYLEGYDCYRVYRLTA